MWILRQKLHPAFRLTAAAVLSFWLVATAACTMHCAGLVQTGTAAPGSCCHRAASSPNASATGTSPQHQPSGSSGMGGSGCLKEYTAGKSAGLTAPQAVIAPQIVWRTPVVKQPPVSNSFLARFDQHLRRGSPALMLGRGLRTLAPPFRLA